MNTDTVYYVDILRPNGEELENYCDSLCEAVAWANEVSQAEDEVSVCEAVRGSDGTTEIISEVMGWIDDGFRSKS